MTCVTQQTAIGAWPPAIALRCLVQPQTQTTIGVPLRRRPGCGTARTWKHGLREASILRAANAFIHSICRDLFTQGTLLVLATETVNNSRHCPLSCEHCSLVEDIDVHEGSTKQVQAATRTTAVSEMGQLPGLASGL